MTVDWEAVRAEFPAIKKSVYLNTAGGGPLPHAVAEAGIRFYEEMRDIGDVMCSVWLARAEEVRSKVARYLNVPASSIAFVPHTSFAMNVVAGYLRYSGVNSVITMADSFPAITVPLSHHGFDMKLIASAADGSVPVDSVRSAITDRIGALVTSSVEYRTGYTHNLPALSGLCKERQLAFIVDATQSLGAFPFDITALNVDFAIASTYKWLLGGYGLSVFYITPKWLAQKPPMAGSKSIADAQTPAIPSTNLKATAAVLELGWPNFPAIFALGAAVDFLANIGLAALESRLRELQSYLTHRLIESGFTVLSTHDSERTSAITAVEVPNPTAVAAQLSDMGVFVSAKGFGLRVSLYLYNNFHDIDRFVEALKAVVV